MGPTSSLPGRPRALPQAPGLRCLRAGGGSGVGFAWDLEANEMLSAQHPQEAHGLGAGMAASEYSALDAVLFNHPQLGGSPRSSD